MTDEDAESPNTWSWGTLGAEAFYDDLGRGEWERLDRDAYHRLEWDGTVEYLDEHLPDSGRVLDAGGAAGRYSVWLAERGYDVTLVDVSEQQLQIAREKVEERDLADAVTVERGDVRDLDFEANRFDATLCLGGPLSHVLDADERETAATELARVTRTGSPVFVSVMGRLAMVQAMVQAVGGDSDADAAAVVLPEFARTGDYDRELLSRHGLDPGCFAAHFFRVGELERLLESGGLTVETVAGLEGVASARRVADTDLEDADSAAREAVEETTDLLREDRTVADLSTHLLAVARVRD
ncbi:class I SAM-dependent methyltransferase [Halobium salinum]|uniref:Class I SAM-dependent methyltransferase n=1 Tax=Halobium salinum TaxID=1364940 RepID=A0ABD5PBE3_9EURY|nr:class I SAM-dependent methyltransferase [Halobium salinum]